MLNETLLKHKESFALRQIYNQLDSKLYTSADFNRDYVSSGGML